MTSRAPLYRHKLYGGFVEGKLYIGLIYLGTRNPIRFPYIFTSKATAREHFQDVREVKISEVRK